MCESEDEMNEHDVPKTVVERSFRQTGKEERNTS